MEMVPIALLQLRQMGRRFSRLRVPPPASAISQSHCELQNVDRSAARETFAFRVGDADEAFPSLVPKCFSDVSAPPAHPGQGRLRDKPSMEHPGRALQREDTEVGAAARSGCPGPVVEHPLAQEAQLVLEGLGPACGPRRDLRGHEGEG